MTQVFLSALLTTALLVLPATADAFDRGDTCTLSDGLTVTAKPKGRGKKRNIPAGTTVTVVKAKRGWVMVKGGRAKGWIKGDELEGYCGGGEAEPEPADPMPPPDDTAGGGMDGGGDDMGGGSDMGAGGGDTGGGTDAPWAGDDGGGGDTGGGDAVAGDEGGGSFGGGGDDDDGGEAEALSPPSDKPFVEAGGGIEFNLDSKDIGFRGEGFVNLGFLVENLRAGTTMVYWLTDADLAIAFNFDAHYTIDVMPKLTAYPLVGTIIGHVRATVLNQTFSETNMGFHLGGGGEYDLGFGKGYVETRLERIAGDWSINFAAGMRFGVL